jgi:hypothetical protein
MKRSAWLEFMAKRVIKDNPLVSTSGIARQINREATISVGRSQVRRALDRLEANGEVESVSEDSDAWQVVR